MNDREKKPTAGEAVGGRLGEARKPHTQPLSYHIFAHCQDPPAVLRKTDYDAYCRLRRKFLLQQAAGYGGGDNGEKRETTP